MIETKFKSIHQGSRCMYCPGQGFPCIFRAFVLPKMPNYEWSKWEVMLLLKCSYWWYKISRVCLCLQLFVLLIFADGQKRKKSLRKKLDSLGKEKNKDRGKGQNELERMHLPWSIMVEFGGVFELHRFMRFISIMQTGFLRWNVIKACFGLPFCVWVALYWIDEFNCFEQSVTLAKFMVPIMMLANQQRIRRTWVE